METWRKDMAGTWQDVQTFVEYHTGIDCSQGIAAFADHWQQTKHAAMGKLFDADGRRITAMDDVLPYNHEEIEKDLQALAHKLIERPRFRRVLYPDAWITVLLKEMQVFSPEEIATNRTIQGKQTMSTSKVLAQRIKGQYGGFSSTEQELVQILFSRAVEIFKPNTNKLNVVLSINPIDILTCSLHTTGWSSCWAITGSISPLAVACDDVTAIAYAYSRTAPMAAVKAEYPVKRWRSFTAFDLQRLSAITAREYPSRQPAIENTCASIIGDILAQHANTEKRQIIRIDDYVGTDGRRWCRSLDGPSAGYRLPTGGVPRVTVGVDVIPCLGCGQPRRDWAQATYSTPFVCLVFLCGRCLRKTTNRQRVAIAE